MGSINTMNIIERLVTEHKDRLLPLYTHLVGAKFTNEVVMEDDAYFYSGVFTLDNGESYPVHFAWVPQEGIDVHVQEDYRQSILSLEGSTITSIDIDGFDLYEDIYVHLCVDGGTYSVVTIPLGFTEEILEL